MRPKRKDPMKSDKCTVRVGKTETNEKGCDKEEKIQIDRMIIMK